MPKRPLPPSTTLAKAPAIRLEALKREWATLPPEWRAQARQRVLAGEARYLLDILDTERER